MSGYYKVKRRKGMFLKLTVTIMIILSLLLIYYLLLVLPHVSAIGKENVKQSASLAANDVLKLSEKYDYNDFVTIIKDKSDKVNVIRLDTFKINKLTHEIAINMQNSVEKICKEKLKINLGAFSGMLFLNDKGPEICLDLKVYGNVVCEYSTAFDSVGINQTKHSLYVKIKLTMGICLPFKTEKVDVSSAAIVCENIIVGDIPQIYHG